MSKISVAIISTGVFVLSLFAGLVLGLNAQDEPLRHVRGIPGQACLEAPRSAVERDDIGVITLDKAALVAEKQARRAYVMRLVRVAHDPETDDITRAALDAEAAAWLQWMERDRS